MLRKLFYELQKLRFGGPEEVRVSLQRALRTRTEEQLLSKLRKIRDHLLYVIGAGRAYLNDM